MNAGASNDVRAREGDYFVGSRALQNTGTSEEHERGAKAKKLIYQEPAGTDFWSFGRLAL